MLLRETKGRAAWSQNISAHLGLVMLLVRSWEHSGGPGHVGDHLHPNTGQTGLGHDKCLCEQPHLVQRQRDETKLSCIEQHTANTKVLQDAQDRGQT